MSIADKLTTIAENVPKVHEAGVNTGIRIGYNNGYSIGLDEGIAVGHNHIIDELLGGAW